MWRWVEAKSDKGFQAPEEQTCITYLIAVVKEKLT